MVGPYSQSLKPGTPRGSRKEEAGSYCVKAGFSVNCLPYELRVVYEMEPNCDKMEPNCASCTGGWWCSRVLCGDAMGDLVQLTMVNEYWEAAFPLWSRGVLLLWSI